MKREEFERIKEAEKAHLRKLKELKQAALRLGRQQRLTRAVDEIAGAADDPMGTHEEFVEKLAFEAARSEAKLEMALESQAEKAAEADAEAAEALDEEALVKARARDLLRQMKQQMGVPDAEATAPAAEADAPAAPEKTLGRTPAAAPPPALEKTHGRPPGAAPPAPAPSAEKPETPPEKTIGRM